MDEEDHGHEFFRPNTNHQVPINIVPSTPTPTYSTNIVSPSSMFRGPVLLLDHQDHDHDHHIHDDDNKLLRFQRNKAIDDQSNHMIMKTQIANHPAYPDLLAAYIQCKKVGAPPETASVLEEIGRSENHMMMMSSTLGLGGCSTQAGADPELDYFMESYCEVLRRFKEELSKPLNEATTFLSNIESQLSNLCEGTLITKTLDYYDQSAAGGINISDQDHHEDEDEEMMVIRSYGDQVAHDHHENSCGVGAGTGDYYYQQGLKEKLLRKYSGYLTMLKTEFLKKRKKVELPKPARNMLLHWWNSHSRWPYPTEEEKAKLSAETGLDQKQINNWFVNQRKRHWKPTEDIKSALINDPST